MEGGRGGRKGMPTDFTEYAHPTVFISRWPVFNHMLHYASIWEVESLFWAVMYPAKIKKFY